MVAEAGGAMDPWKEPLDLEIGDTIIWRGDDLRIRNDEEGMIRSRLG